MAKERIADQIPVTVKATTIAGFVGMTPQRVAQLGEEGLFPTPGEKGAYPFREAVLAICEDLRRRSKGKYDGEIETRKRRETSEADEAELRTSKLSGELIAKEDAELFWRDNAIETRRAVEEADYLKPAQKTRLLAALAKIKAGYE